MLAICIGANAVRGNAPPSGAGGISPQGLGIRGAGPRSARLFTASSGRRGPARAEQCRFEPSAPDPPRLPSDGWLLRGAVRTRRAGAASQSERAEADDHPRQRRRNRDRCTVDGGTADPPVSPRLASGVAKVAGPVEISDAERLFVQDAPKRGPSTVPSAVPAWFAALSNPPPASGLKLSPTAPGEVSPR